MPEERTDDFGDLVAAFNRHRVEFLIVGAHAVAFHGYARGTKDLDILLRLTPENLPRVLAALDEFGFGSLGLEESDFTADNVIQLGHPPNRVDLMGSISGVDSARAWRTRVRGTYQGQIAAFLSRGCLLENKRATGREQDRLDARMLERQARLARPRKRRGDPPRR